VHLAVDTLGHLLALYMTPANASDRKQVAELTKQVQNLTNGSVEIGFANAGYTGQPAAQAAAEQAVQLQMITLLAVRRGFVLLPHRFVVTFTLAPKVHNML